ncbi:MAG: acyltransferase family protein, partial [Ktedonobacteraceae bacterium]
MKKYLAIFQTKQAQNTATGQKNIAGLEGLRAFAALGVVTLHTTYLVGHALMNEYTYPWFASFWVFGNTGVQLFFVLSGFLLFMPYARALLFHEKWPVTRQFYRRRALRILPGYYFSLFMLVFFIQRAYLLPDHWPQLFLFLTFFMDSSRATFQQINVPYWSLGIEVQFYLFLPFVALGIGALVKRVAHTPGKRLQAALLACVCLIFVGLAVRYEGLQLAQLPQRGTGFLAALLTGFQFVFFGVSGKYWEDFAIGMLVSLCFMYAQHPEYGQALRDRSKQFSLLIGISALVVLTISALWNFRTSYPVAQLNFILPLVPY